MKNIGKAILKFVSFIFIVVIIGVMIIFVLDFTEVIDARKIWNDLMPRLKDWWGLIGLTGIATIVILIIKGLAETMKFANQASQLQQTSLTINIFDEVKTQKKSIDLNTNRLGSMESKLNLVLEYMKITARKNARSNILPEDIKNEYKDWLSEENTPVEEILTIEITQEVIEKQDEEEVKKDNSKKTDFGEFGGLV